MFNGAKEKVIAKLIKIAKSRFLYHNVSQKRIKITVHILQ
jgi:hypothetical protein